MNTTNPENRRILIIDDNPAIHNDIRRILLPQDQDDKLDAARAELFGDISETPRFARFEIDSAYQGQEGFEKLLVGRDDRQGRPVRPAGHPEEAF